MYAGSLTCLVAWGILAFGGVYAWGYVPLTIGASLMGAWSLVTRVRFAHCRPGPSGWATGGVLCAVLLQLLPLPVDVLRRISPHTDDFLLKYDLRYAFRAPGGGVHALSVNPLETFEALVFVCGLVLLAWGVSVSLDNASLRSLVRNLLVLAVSTAIVGLAQRTFPNGKIYWFWEPEFSAFNAFGPFVNRNHFAGWMLLMTSLGLGEFCALVASARIPGEGDWRDRLLWLGGAAGARVLLVGAAVFVMALSLVWTM